jgi:hypothetical protein
MQSRSQWPRDSKAWVCGRSLAGIVGSNRSGGTDVCLWWVLCDIRQKYVCLADHSSREILPTLVCLGVFERPQRHWPIRGCIPGKHWNTYIQGDSLARDPKLLSIKIRLLRQWLENLYIHSGNNAKEDLLIIDAENGLLSHPSTLEDL